VPGHGDAPAPPGGAAVPALIRGNIVAHLSSMSEPDASADGGAPANPLVNPGRAADGITLPPSTAAPPSTLPPTEPPPPVSARRRIWPVVFTIVVVVVLAAALIAAHTSLNQYVITPGDATPVAPFIEVPAADNHPLTGKILLTDVYVTQLNALNYLQYRFFDSDSEVISGPELLGPTPNEDQYLAQGYLQMAQAQSYATAAALTRLGYTVTSSNVGALVYGIAAHSPAASTLQVAQVITAVDGSPITTDCSLIHALHGLQPGHSAALQVEQSSINDVGQFVRGPVVTKSVTLGTPPKGLIDTGCGTPTKPTAYLGIDPETQQDWQFPVKVTVHTKDIGGPSAGLAMTLGIMDKLSSGRLTGNRIVAATGTIDQYGNVGDVGGVAEKTIAVEREGATVFFVPSVELTTAESKATPQLHVYAVNNLSQVLRILTRLGGRVPTKPVAPRAP
jgi:Lon-like protease